MTGRAGWQFVADPRLVRRRPIVGVAWRATRQFLARLSCARRRDVDPPECRRVDEYEAFEGREILPRPTVDRRQILAGMASARRQRLVWVRRRTAPDARRETRQGLVRSAAAAADRNYHR